VKRKFNYEYPGYTGGLIVCFASIPSLPNLISQFLINQQGFDVDLGEHGGNMEAGFQLGKRRI
jgi:hypothetical protein